MTERKQFEEFTPNKVCVKEPNIGCPMCGGPMMRLMHNTARREELLACQKGECGIFTIIDDWTLSELDALEQNPSHRCATYRLGDYETTSSVQVFLNYVEKRHSVTLNRNFRKRIRDARPYLRIYIAGRYSDPDRNKVIHNVFAAIDAGIQVMRKGHQVFVPHAMTWAMDTRAKNSGLSITYDEWTELDDTFLKDWADALLLVSNSPGADHELEKAKALGKKIFRSVDEVPYVD